MRIEVVNGNGQAQARGVYFEATDYRLAGRRFYAQARREVVLCAGALVSPQILQLRWVGLFCQCEACLKILGSGIGPREHLEKVGIPVQCDLPGVGNHLVSIPRLATALYSSHGFHRMAARPHSCPAHLRNPYRRLLAWTRSKPLQSRQGTVALLAHRERHLLLTLPTPCHLRPVPPSRLRRPSVCHQPSGTRHVGSRESSRSRDHAQR